MITGEKNDVINKTDDHSPTMDSQLPNDIKEIISFGEQKESYGEREMQSTH